VIYEVNVIMYVCKYFLDTSIITLAQGFESTRMGGDRSINSLCSRRLLKFSSLLKNEKKKKRNPEVIGEEDDKTAM